MVEAASERHPCLRKVVFGCQHRGPGAGGWLEPVPGRRRHGQWSRVALGETRPHGRGGSSGVLTALVSARALGAVGFLPPNRPVASVTVAADIRLRIDCLPSHCFKISQNADEVRTVDRHMSPGETGPEWMGVGCRHSLQGLPEPVPWPLRAGGAFPGCDPHRDCRLLSTDPGESRDGHRSLLLFKRRVEQIGVDAGRLRPW